MKLRVAVNNDGTDVKLVNHETGETLEGVYGIALHNGMTEACSATIEVYLFNEEGKIFVWPKTKSPR